MGCKVNCVARVGMRRIHGSEISVQPVNGRMKGMLSTRKHPAIHRLYRDFRLLYRLKRPWRNGTTHVVFEPLELIEKLAALVPPPRFNLTDRQLLFAAGGIIPRIGAESDLKSPAARARQRIWAALGAANELKTHKNTLVPIRRQPGRAAVENASCRELHALGSNDRLASSVASRSKS